MSDAALSAALAVCLTAGAVDLLALNLVVLPAARAALPASYRSRAEPRASTIEPGPRVPAPSMFGSHAEARVSTAMRDSHPQLAADLSSVPIAARTAPRAEPAPVAILEFEISSRRVDRRAASRLSQTLTQLREASEIVVIGHADASGPEPLNDQLSAQRAAAVARCLVESGIRKMRIRVAARGEHEPRGDGNSRRVEIFVGGRS